LDFLSSDGWQGFLECLPLELRRERCLLHESRQQREGRAFLTEERADAKILWQDGVWQELQRR
jgi:hypothetical protein